MCNPALAMMAISMAGSAMSAVQQSRAAEAQMQATVDAYKLDQEALQAQMDEENDAVRLQQFERMRQAMKEQSALAVALGEANMTGNTPFMELSDVLAQADYDISIMESNREKAMSQGGRSQQKVFADAKGRINTAQAQGGNLLTNGLAIVGAGVKGYTTGAALGEQLSGLGSAPTTSMNQTPNYAKIRRGRFVE